LGTARRNRSVEEPGRPERPEGVHAVANAALYASPRGETPGGRPDSGLRLDAPKDLARRVHELYFAPQHDDFQPHTMWSLSNAFTSAF
jgi:hypothetical protein